MYSLIRVGHNFYSRLGGIKLNEESGAIHFASSSMVGLGLPLLIR